MYLRYMIKMLLMCDAVDVLSHMIQSLHLKWNTRKIVRINREPIDAI